MSDVIGKTEFADGEVVPLDHPIPLPSGKVAWLRVPHPMSAKDAKLLKSVLLGTLKLLRPGIVKEPPPPSEHHPPATSDTPDA